MIDFHVGQKLFLKIEVENPEKAKDLLTWLYKDRAIVEVKDYGCKLTEISWMGREDLYKKLLDPIKEAIQRGEI